MRDCQRFGYALGCCENRADYPVKIASSENFRDFSERHRKNRNPRKSARVDKRAEKSLGKPWFQANISALRQEIGRFALGQVKHDFTALREKSYFFRVYQPHKQRAARLRSYNIRAV